MRRRLRYRPSGGGAVGGAGALQGQRQNMAHVSRETSNGARTAWLSAPWTAMSIELIEVPGVMLAQTPKALLTPSTEAA